MSSLIILTNMNMETALSSQKYYSTHDTLTENCKDIALNLLWHHLNMNLGEDELTISHRIEKKPINGVDNQKIFIKPSKIQLTHRIFYTIYEVNPPFHVNYYLIYSRSKIDNIICQLKLNYPNKIKKYHSYNNETCILYNTCEYSSNVTSTSSLINRELNLG